ncbi:MAG: glycine cleavage system transcriptional repressor [Candidatus Xenobia bacterium]
MARVLYDSGCNIEDSSMTILGGEFAMILIVKLPDNLDGEAFRSRFAEAEKSFSLFINVKELPPQAPALVGLDASSPYTISVYGADRPGIVYRITRELSDHGINVTDLETKVVGEAGRPVYVMVLEVDVPASQDFDAITANLRRIATELSVDLTVNTAEALPL